MFILNWFKDVLGALGLYKKNAKILFLGLDNAGKTTLLRRLKDDRMVQHDPTIHAHAEELVLGNVRFKAYDLGGHETVRKTWKTYFPTVDGIIYLVDAADKTRFDESKKELEMLLATPELAKVPVVILGNKIDKKDAASEEEIRGKLGLTSKTSWGQEKVTELDGRPVEVFMCSVAKKTGYAEGFRWLSQFLK
jgi:GTP-binding protein SAR1